MRGLFIAAVLLFGTLRNAGAQLDAPGAFSSFSGCAHDTCLWVPTAESKVFTHGEYRYTVITNKDETEAKFQLTKGSAVLLSTPLKDWSASVSVVWSKEGSSFAITWSDGGAVGDFHVRAFRISGNQLKEEPVAKYAMRNFKTRHNCIARGDNIQAYKWSNSGDKLLLVLSVYPASDCGRDLGHMEAYWVQADNGAILQHLNLRELKAYIKLHPQM
ncbi:MAG: hypothetical protein P4L10_05770 [Acidobacteriaceae bacterium]|nr:hypothetical protein [Acidobacteriaceae bacterium]